MPAFSLPPCFDCFFCWPLLGRRTSLCDIKISRTAPSISTITARRCSGSRIPPSSATSSGSPVGGNQGDALQINLAFQAGTCDCWQGTHPQMPYLRFPACRGRSPRSRFPRASPGNCQVTACQVIYCQVIICGPPQSWRVGVSRRRTGSTGKMLAGCHPAQWLRVLRLSEARPWSAVARAAALAASPRACPEFAEGAAIPAPKLQLFPLPGCSYFRPEAHEGHRDPFDSSLLHPGERKGSSLWGPGCGCWLRMAKCLTTSRFTIGSHKPLGEVRVLRYHSAQTRC